MEKPGISETKDSPIPDQTELELKMTKIRSMIDTVDHRIAAHERRTEKLNHVQEQRLTRDQISRLTRSILESI